MNEQALMDFTARVIARAPKVDGFKQIDYFGLFRAVLDALEPFLSGACSPDEETPGQAVVRFAKLTQKRNLRGRWARNRAYRITEKETGRRTLRDLGGSRFVNAMLSTTAETSTDEMDLILS